MKSERLLKEIGNISEEYMDISENESEPPKKHNRIRYIMVGTAAALMIAFGGVSAGVMLTRQNVPSSEASSNAVETAGKTEELAVAVETLDITVYYVDGGDIKSNIINMECSPKIIFGEWKKLNKSADKAQFIRCRLDNNGTEITTESTATYIAGDEYTFELTLSEGSEEIFEGEEGKKLMLSLEKTFSDYFAFDDRITCTFSVKFE